MEGGTTPGDEMATGDETAELTLAPKPGRAPTGHLAGRIADMIQNAEQGVYVVIGGMLILALVLALVGAFALLFEGARDLGHTDAIFQIIDRLLFVLMLVEILHTVHASIRSGTLVCEPFLIVGLIACIRRILVITLETSQITQPDRWSVGNNVPLFQASMIELGVLGLLIVVLVGSIRFTRGASG